MNHKKFCFIACTNSPLFMEECKHYIETLYVPEGYEIDLLTIEGAKSMASGYNEAMKSSDAKFKIYLHQDVFIINKYFLHNLIDIFGQDDNIGLIGMVGQSKMPSSGMMWDAREIGNMYNKNDIEEISEEEYLRFPYQLADAEAIDGFCMITSKDLEWREDIFDGWDLYDASQSAEFLRAGYRVVVPLSPAPWCVHDDGRILSLWNYDKYRQRYLKEYTLNEKNEKGISFILVYNNENYYMECCYYINKLKIPEGFTVDIIAVAGESSSAAAYNEGMHKSNAKYKVYLHQDTFIVNPDFISDVLQIFESDTQIGLIGLMGGINLASDFIIYNSWNQGKAFKCNVDATLQICMECKEDKGLYMLSEAVDGMIMITQYDILWREDLFTEWDFYDISQSCEFRCKDYKVVVANQKVPWCLQDCGHRKLDRYDANRKIFLEKYPDFLASPDKEDIVFDEPRYNLAKEISEKFLLLIKQGYLSEVVEALDNSFESLPRLNELSLMKNILTIYKSEMNLLNVNIFMAHYKEYEQICTRYEQFKFYLRRVEYFADADAINFLKEKVRKKEVSEVALALISKFSCTSGDRIMRYISEN